MAIIGTPSNIGSTGPTRVPLVAAIGSSSLAGEFSGSLAVGLNRGWGGVMNAANILSQGRFYMPASYNCAVSGQFTSHMASGQLARVLALNPQPRGCYIQPGSNDIRNGIPWAETVKNINTIVDALLYVGITPIVGVPQSTIGDTDAIQKSYARLARYLRDLSVTKTGCILVDPTPQYMNAALATYESLSAYMDANAPRIHLNHYGSQIYGEAITAALAEAGWPENNDVALKSNGDLYDATNNPRGNLLANGMMSGTTGGVTAPATGTAPTGWAFTPASVGGTVALSQPASGMGCTVTFSGTTTSVSQPMLLYRDLSVGERAALAAGDTLELVVEASWSALVNVLCVSADLSITQNGVPTDDWDAFANSQSGPLNETPSAIIRPIPRRLTAVPTQVRPRLAIYAETNGVAFSGAVTWKSCVVRKVTA